MGRKKKTPVGEDEGLPPWDVRVVSSVAGMEAGRRWWGGKTWGE